MDQIVSIKARKPRGQGASRRGEILAAAKHLFAVEGVDQVTMRRIAADVGVSPTALYMHFADKDAMLAAIAQDTFAELVDCLKASQRPEQTPLAGFRAGLRAYVEFGLARPDAYRLTFMTQLSGRTGLKTCAFEMADRSFTILRDSVARLIDQAVFRSGNATLLAQTIWAMLHGVTALLLDQQVNLEAEPRTLIDSALDLVEAGLLDINRLQHKPC